MAAYRCALVAVIFVACSTRLRSSSPADIVRLVASAALAVLGLLSAPPTFAQSAVDLDLVIAADVSVSMDAEEKLLQQRGFADAFRDRDIVDAIASGPLGRIAVTYFEWGGASQQRLVITRSIIHDAGSAEAFAARLEANRPARLRRGTSISAALDYSVALFGASDVTAARRVINISSDGMNNKGPDLPSARQRALAAGIEINGLPIVYKNPLHGVIDSVGLDDEAAFTATDLITYFEREVIGGPGAFLEPVFSPTDYRDATLRKLRREIIGPQQAAAELTR